MRNPPDASKFDLRTTRSIAQFMGPVSTRSAKKSSLDDNIFKKLCEKIQKRTKKSAYKR